MVQQEISPKTKQNGKSRGNNVNIPAPNPPDLSSESGEKAIPKNINEYANMEFDSAVIAAIKLASSNKLNSKSLLSSLKEVCILQNFSILTPLHNANATSKERLLAHASTFKYRLKVAPAITRNERGLFLFDILTHRVGTADARNLLSNYGRTADPDFLMKLGESRSFLRCDVHALFQFDIGSFATCCGWNFPNLGFCASCLGLNKQALRLYALQFLKFG